MNLNQNPGENLKQWRERLITEAKATAHTAQKDGRDLTSDEADRINSRVEQIKTLTDKIKSSEETSAKLAALGKPGQKSAAELLQDPSNFDKWGNQINGFLDNGQKKGDPEGFVKKLRNQIEGKTAMTGTNVLDNRPASRKEKAQDLAGKFHDHVHAKGLFAPGSIVEPVSVFDKPVLLQQDPLLSLSNILQVRTVAKGQFSYIRQTTRDNKAAFTAPGELKPVSSYGFEEVKGELKTLASISEPIHNQWLWDHPETVAAVIEEMLYGFVKAEEAQVLGGDGLGQNLTGLLNTSGIQTHAAGASDLATIRAAITKAELLGFTPDAFVVHPLDWERIELSQNTPGDYLLTGAPVDRAARRIWGVPALPHAGVPQGTAVLLDSSAVVLFSDETMRVDAQPMGDDFQRNQIHIRMEQRYELGVIKPLGVVKISLPTTP